MVISIEYQFGNLYLIVILTELVTLWEDKHKPVTLILVGRIGRPSLSLHAIVIKLQSELPSSKAWHLTGTLFPDNTNTTAVVNRQWLNTSAWRMVTKVTVALNTVWDTESLENSSGELLPVLLHPPLLLTLHLPEVLTPPLPLPWDTEDWVSIWDVWLFPSRLAPWGEGGL